jgi:hypothetical protein
MLWELKMLQLIIIIILAALGLKYSRYKKSIYKDESGNSFFKTIFNKGNYGEFCIFEKLEHLECNKKLLTNLYLPKYNDPTETTEIDIVMICSSGIFVFEVKNYKGWIYGNEKSKYWTQTFNKNSKFKFLNPIWQNKLHTKSLISYLGNSSEQIVQSIIVFTKRSEFKNVNVSPESNVITENQFIKYLIRYIENDSVLSETQINDIFNQLKSFNKVDKSTKKNHIEKINKLSI